MAQLRSTLAVLQSRRELAVPDALRESLLKAMATAVPDLVRHLSQLYALAVALHPATADDLVQETISRAVADPSADTSDAALAARLTDPAGQWQPAFESPSTPTLGDDPDADTAELVYPSLYGEGAQHPAAG